MILVENYAVGDGELVDGTREVGRDDHGWPQEPHLASSSLHTDVDTHVHTLTFTLTLHRVLGVGWQE